MAGKEQTRIHTTVRKQFNCYLKIEKKKLDLIMFAHKCTYECRLAYNIVS